MNNKAFTVVELLGIIVILSLIFLVTVPAINKMSEDSKNKIFNKNINSILNGANDWAYDNASLLPDLNKKIYITLGQLKDGGYVSLNIKNAKTGELFSNDMIITITNVGTTSKNENIKYSKYNGNFLFSVDVESGSINAILDEEAPSIILNGDIVTNVEINNTYIEPGYTALNSDGEDISSKVTTEIRTDTDAVLEIDSTKFKVYYIYYTVNDNGKTATVIRTVIVSDTKPPEITLPTNNTISSSVTSYDIMDGVSCTDNSGICDINYSGEITFGVSDKYVITYTATDSSGNTATEKRVIIVE